MKQITLDLINIHGEICMLGGYPALNDKLTVHHIIPQRDNGPTTLENCVLLTESRHRLFNLLEHHYPDLAREVNQYLYRYRGFYPFPIWERILLLLDLAEHGSSKNYARPPYVKSKKRHRHRH